MARNAHFHLYSLGYLLFQKVLILAWGLQTTLLSRFAALQRGLGRNEDQLISARIYHERTDGFQD